MKYIYCSLAAMLLSFHSYAQQDTIWWTGGLSTISFNQTSFSNWAAGGENSIAANALLNLYAKYKNGRHAWDNSLDLGYGLVKPGVKDVRKSDDKIDLLSKYGYDINNKNKLFYTFLLNFKSQFTEGFEYPTDTTKVLISDFLAPGYLLLALGIDFKPEEYFSVFLSPLTAKFTFVNHQDLADAGSFGVEPATYNELGVKTSDGENLRSEFGAYLNVKFQKDVLSNVNLLTKLDLFSNYSENPQNIDVNWEVLLGMKINTYLTASISTHLIYDDDVNIQEYEERNGFRIPKLRPDGVTPLTGPRVQFKEVLAIGFSYKF